VPWFDSFLATFPNNDGFKTIKQINFPREYTHNAFKAGRVIDERNPNVQLMLRCPSLDIMATTFKWHVLTICSPVQYCNYVHKNIDDLLNQSQLRPMLDHPSLKQVRLEGLYVSEGKEGDPLRCLEEFAK
jgi:hypothetical protein